MSNKNDNITIEEAAPIVKKARRKSNLVGKEANKLKAEMTAFVQTCKKALFELEHNEQRENQGVDLILLGLTDDRHTLEGVQKEMKGTCSSGYKKPKHFVCRDHRKGCTKHGKKSKRLHKKRGLPCAEFNMHFYDFQNFMVHCDEENEDDMIEYFKGFLDFLVREEKISSFPRLQKISNRLLKKLMKLDGEEKAIKEVQMNKLAKKNRYYSLLRASKARRR